MLENTKKHSCLLISDFNMDNFSACLSNIDELPIVTSKVAPFGQVMEVLMQGNLELWNREYNLVVVWTRPEGIIKSFGKILMHESVLIEEILREVDTYATSLMYLRDRAGSIFVPTWTLHSNRRDFGMLDMKPGIGIANTLMRMNLRLSEKLSETSSFYLMNSIKWIEVAGKKAFNPKLWYMAKVPFGNDVFKEATKDIKAALRGINGNSRKIIILDLDETLWGGIVGDVGWENLKVGGHDHIGEAYTDFQRALKSLRNRGILLGIVSKNEESLALEALDKHPEIILRQKDFVGWRINWEDKAKNVVNLISDLNLGLQSVVFIDDNPVERARVREALPEVFVPEWPEDKMLYADTLLGLRCFDAPSVSKEDIGRTKMYVANRQREDLKKEIGSLDEWLKTLCMKVKIEELNTSNLQRTAQLLNKTNQMNLSTRRMTEPELVRWAKQHNRKLWVFRISDKFGDSGLTGIISIEIDKEIGRIKDFVLSCRVMGRKIEETMLYIIIKYAQSIGLNRIYAKYIPTPKNKPCLDFWKRSGFIRNEREQSFMWEVKNKYILPDCIQIDGEKGFK